MGGFSLFGSISAPDFVQGKKSQHASVQSTELAGVIFVVPSSPPPVAVTGPQIVVVSGFACDVSFGGSGS